MEHGDSSRTLNLEKFSTLHLVISMQVLHAVLYIFPVLLMMENLSNNQELLEFGIISFILLTLMFGSGVIL